MEDSGKAVMSGEEEKIVLVLVSSLRPVELGKLRFAQQSFATAASSEFLVGVRVCALRL